MHLLTRSLKVFNNYINGGRTRALRRPLKVYDYNLEQLDCDFNQTTIDNIHVRDYIETIIESLCIPQKRALSYFDSHLTIYKFLQELSKDGHIQANYLLEIIDKKTKISKLALFTGGLISAAVLATIATNPLLSEVVNVVIGFAESPIGIPVLSGLFTTGLAIYNICMILTDGKKTEFNLIRDLCFTILKSVISLTACALLIASSIIITPFVASVFIAGLVVLSSVINMGKELFCLVQELVQKNNPSFENSSPLYSHRAALRHEIAYKQHRNAAVINLIVAIAALGVTVVSSFVPGGFLIVVGAVAAFALIYGIQYALLKLNDKIMREELQEGIKKINDEHLEYNEFEMQNMSSAQTDLVDQCELSESDEESSVQSAVDEIKEEDTAQVVPLSTSKLSSSASSFFNQNKSNHVNEKDKSPDLEETPSVPTAMIKAN